MPGYGLNVKGLQSTFFQRLNEIQPTTWYERVSTRIQSTTDREHHRWLGQVPQMREWGTGRQAVGLMAESYDVANEKYELTLEVDRDELDDDQTGQIAVRTMELGERAATHKDYLISRLLINGSSTGFNSYDGVPFFDANHVSGSSGTQSNEITFDISDSATAGETDNVNLPTPFQCSLALQTAISTMQGFVDDKGEPMMIPASGLIVMCPTVQQWSWRQAVGSGLFTLAGGQISNVTNNIADVLPNPYLTDTSKFYLLKTDVTVRPFIFQDRMPLEFAAINNTSEDTETFLTEKYKYGVRARYKMAYGRWMYAISCDFTT